MKAQLIAILIIALCVVSDGAAEAHGKPSFGAMCNGTEGPGAPWPDHTVTYTDPKTGDRTTPSP